MKTITFVPLRQNLNEKRQNVIAELIFKELEERNIKPKHYIHWSINVEYLEGDDEN